MKVTVRCAFSVVKHDELISNDAMMRCHLMVLLQNEVRGAICCNTNEIDYKNRDRVSDALMGVRDEGN